jgi:ketosteroid isomerase-like protein
MSCTEKIELMKFATAFAAVLMCAGTVAAQAPAQKEITQVETAWARAVEKVDAAALDRILADDLVYSHSTGLVETKQDYLKSVQSGNQKYASVESMNPKVRVYGDTAVVNTKVRMTGSTKGQPFDNQLLMIHVWVKKQGRWQLVAHQTTRLP